MATEGSNYAIPRALIWPLIIYVLTSAPVAGIYVVANTTRMAEQISVLQVDAAAQRLVLERLTRIETTLDFIKQNFDNGKR